MELQHPATREEVIAAYDDYLSGLHITKPPSHDEIKSELRGKTLACCANVRAVFLYEVATGKEIRRLQGSRSLYFALIHTTADACCLGSKTCWAAWRNSFSVICSSALLSLSELIPNC